MQEAWWVEMNQRGKNIFIYNQNAQCMKCHAYDDRGGNAGPRLNGIANRISREQILQALITPSARLSPGYGMSTIELKDGKKLFGTLEKENATSITLKIGGEPVQVIQKSQVVKRNDSPSSMPDMKKILSKREIRDVVSFLTTLKENNLKHVETNLK
jgi:putative heme-binding domain-containing protein